jgi:serine/threonine-protein kinase
MFPGEIDVPPATYLDQLGTIFTRFDTQDSGNIAYGVQTDDARYFVKTAGDPSYTRPYLDFDGRVALLRTAAELAASVTHHTMPTLHTVIESPTGPLLVYEWRDGDLLHDPPARERFRALPTEEILAALGDLYELHVALDSAGWVEGDFYDGALLYDFAARRLTAIDLDTYHRGPYRNTMGRMFGSERFMAPEELTLGAPVDSRTTAYVMARTALVLLPEPPPALHTVLLEATTARFPSYQAFYDRWLTASSTTADSVTNLSTSTPGSG